MVFVLRLGVVCFTRGIFGGFLGLIMGGGFQVTLFLLRMEEEAMERPRVLPCRQLEMRGGCRHTTTSPVKFAAICDEFRGNPITDKVTCSRRVIDPDCQVLVHFEMKVRGVHPMIIAYRSNPLPPLYLLALPDKDPVQMTIQRVRKV